MIELTPMTERAVLGAALFMLEHGRPALHVLEFLAACEPFIVPEPVPNQLVA